MATAKRELTIAQVARAVAGQARKKREKAAAVGLARGRLEGPATQEAVRNDARGLGGHAARLGALPEFLYLDLLPLPEDRGE